MLYTIVGMLVIILDQVVKFWVDKNITYDAPIKDLIPGVISLVRVQNDGAAFSFLAGGGARVWFIVLTGVFTLMVVLALATNFISGKFGRWCLVLVTAGGLANCIDRVLYGYVLDMFKVDLFNFAVFNVADIFITVFAILFIIYILFGGEKELEDDADEFDEEDVEPVTTVKLPKINKREKVVREEIPTSSFKRPVSRRKDDDIPVNRSYSAKDSSRDINNMASSQEFEDFFAQRRAAAPSQQQRQQMRPKAPSAQQPQVNVEQRAYRTAPQQRPVSNDPFAEWDRVSGTTPKTAQAETPVQTAQPVQRAPQPTYEQPVQTAPVKPAQSYSSSDVLDLDSILNEFK